MKRWLPILLLAASATAQPLPSTFPVLQEEITPARAIELALKNSPDPALARWQVKIRQAEREIAASASRLKVGLGAFVAGQNTSMIYTTAAEPTFLQTLPPPSALNLNGMVMFPLYTGGLLEHRLAAAEKSERGAEALQDLTILETARDVRIAYFMRAQAQAQRDALEWELGARSELVRLAQHRLRLGKIARYVVLRAEADVAEAQQRHNELVASLQEQEAKLKSLLVISLESQLSYPTEFALPPAPSSLEESLALAFRLRPDRVAANYAIAEADEGLLAALADYSPKLYAVGMLEGMKVDVFGNTPISLGYSLGLVVSFPLYDGGLRAAQSERSQAELEIRKLRLQKLDLEIQQQVATTHSRYLSSLANTILAEVELQKATEEHRVAQLRFAVGRGIYLEVLDSLAARSRARANQLRALYESHVNYAQWLYATGQLQ